MEALRDSLDAINYPVPKYNQYGCDVTLRVYNQEQWNGVVSWIKKQLASGYKNILVEVRATTLNLQIETDSLIGLKYPEANIRIQGNGVKMIPEGTVYSKQDKNKKKISTHYALPCKDFCLDDVFLDGKNKPLSLYEDYFYIETPIEEVKAEGTEDVLNADGSLFKTIYRIWRFKTDLPDLSETECKDFYILLTRNWTSYRHKVVKVENGFLYFRLKSDDATTLVKMTLSPNSDMTDYRLHPRCRLINSPLSEGVYVKEDTIHIPKGNKRVREGKGAQLLVVKKCNFNSLELSGFNVKGAGNYDCVEIHNCTLNDQLWVRDNSFENMSGRDIRVSVCRNACIYNNQVYGTRMNAVYCTGWNMSVWKNELKNIGYMSQTMALTVSGDKIHVFENVIEDFNYSGISTGGDPVCIIEHNIIRYTPGFLKRHKNVTLADGGGIYVNPWCKRGIIRNNVIENITGTGANRGIFLDDGGKNLYIYGNLIMNTANSYDIDLRLCDTYAKQIPNHNTNNAVFHNIMTGGYRFEDRGAGSNCRGGDNILLGTGKWQRTTTRLSNFKQDIELKGCQYKKGKMIIPKKYGHVLERVHMDSFVRNNISLK